LPLTVTPPSANTTTLTITTKSTNTSLYRNSSSHVPASFLAAILCCFGLKKLKRLHVFLLLLIFMVGFGFLTSCGGGSSAGNSSSGSSSNSGGSGGSGGTQPGSYKMTLTASSGTLSHSKTLNLIIN
jgi:uncharacterized membrane protein YgcG